MTSCLWRSRPTWPSLGSASALYQAMAPPSSGPCWQGSLRPAPICSPAIACRRREAHGLGLVHRVVEPDALLDEAMALADRLAGLSPHAVAATKRALALQVESAALAGFEFAIDAESRSFDTPELRATVRRHADTAADQEDGGE